MRLRFPQILEITADGLETICKTMLNYLALYYKK